MRPGEDVCAARDRVRRELTEPVATWKTLKRLKHYVHSGTEEPGVLVDMVAACQQLRANIDGVEAEILQRLQDVRPGSALGEELATRLAIPTGAADRVLDRAAALDDYLEVHFALLGGDIDQRKADTFIDTTRTLPVLEARAVHRAILPEASRLTYRQVKNRLRAAVLAVDGDLAQKRHERTLPDRHVRMSSADDGMAYLTFFLSATDAAKAMSVLDALAVKEGPEDERNVGARRVDAFVKILNAILDSGRTPNGEPVPTQHRKRPHLVFSVAQSTLDGEDDAPGYLAGYGPLAADIVRHLANAGEAATESPRNSGAADHRTEESTAHPSAAPAKDAKQATAGSSDGPHRNAEDAATPSDDRNPRPPRPNWAAGTHVRPMPTCSANGTLISPARGGQDQFPGAFADDPVAALASQGVLSTDGYQPGTRLRDFILARDGTCRFPTCQQPARRCQIDHIVPFDPAKPAWMQTHQGNLHLLCARHHQLKTAGVWTVTREAATGDTHWISPLGYRYTRPAEVVDPTYHLPTLHAALRAMRANHADDHGLHEKPAPIGPGLAPEEQWLSSNSRPSLRGRASSPRVSVLDQIRESIKRSIEEHEATEGRKASERECAPKLGRPYQSNRSQQQRASDPQALGRRVVEATFDTAGPSAAATFPSTTDPPPF